LVGADAENLAEQQGVDLRRVLRDQAEEEGAKTSMNVSVSAVATSRRA